MNVNPMMIYFGQETGEMGMNAEGYSGRDGKTSIFDYWSISSIRRWRNKGKYGTEGLNKNEIELQQLYRKILNLCHSEKAISDGLFFDLMYANMNSWKFNSDKQYAFLRKHKNELILFVVNFDDKKVDVEINLPIHAFEYLDMEEVPTIRGVNLLTDEEREYSLLSSKPVTLSTPKYGAKIVKFTF